MSSNTNFISMMMMIQLFSAVLIVPDRFVTLELSDGVLSDIQLVIKWGFLFEFESLQTEIVVIPFGGLHQLTEYQTNRTARYNTEKMK